MNYYSTPNYYQNYSYNTATPQYGGGLQYNNAPQFQMQNSLNGKIVDSADIVKATEVPIGSYGVFPKADLSEIYIKTWNNNGTTNIITFRPLAPAESEKKNENDINTLLEKMTVLENKIDLLTNSKNNNFDIAPPQKELNTVKKEIRTNDY